MNESTALSLPDGDTPNLAVQTVEPRPQITAAQAKVDAVALSAAEIERRKKFGKAALRHGRYKTAEHWAWLAMRQRCQNQNNPCYHLYGGRGITVCDRWESFEAFFADMGPRPPRHSLERLDNSRGYSPDNCAWRPQADQLRNTRRTIRVTIEGTTKCLKDWAKEFGIRYSVVIQRIHRDGRTPIEALTKGRL